MGQDFPGHVRKFSVIICVREKWQKEQKCQEFYCLVTISGPSNPTRLLERIQSSLPLVAQLVTARQVITSFFGEHFYLGSRAPTLPTVISEQYLLKLGLKYMLIIK